MTEMALEVAPKDLRVVVGETASTAVAAQAKASIEARYTMAMHRPRNWMEVAVKLNDACRRPGVAEEAEYKLSRGGKEIVGPSIRFAEEALRAAGNILSEVTVVFDDDEKRIVRITMTDLESNWSIPRDIVLNKTVERRDVKSGQKVLSSRTNSENKVVYTVQATEDDLLFKQNALVSKVMRTDGLRLIPTDIKDDALAIAAETRRTRDAKDPAGAAKKIAAKFFALGVSVTQLEDFLGKPLTALVETEIEALRLMYGALSEGEATWAEFVEEKGKSESAAKDRGERVSATDALRERLTKKGAA